MPGHFDYLFKDEDTKFFQKVAISAAGITADIRVRETPALVPLTKTAAPTAFEKVAGRLERDMEILKVAGPSGMNSGMMKRGAAYMGVVMTQVDLAPAELGEVFDKVAAAAIQTDLTAAHDQLCERFPRHQHIVDDVLIKIGQELIESAWEAKRSLLEKLGISIGSLSSINRIGHVAEEAGALGNAAKAARGVGAAAEGASGVARAAESVGARAAGAGEAAAAGGSVSPMVAAKAGLAGAGNVLKSGVKAVGNAVATPFRAVSNKLNDVAGKMIKNHQSALDSAPGRIQAQIERHGSMTPASSAGKAMKEGVVDSLKKQKVEAEGAKAKSQSLREGKIEGDRQQGQASAAAAAAPPKETPSSTTPPKSTGGATQVEKSLADTPIKNPTSATPKVDAPKGEHTPSPPGGEEGKPPGFMDAWKKATTKGWGGLAPEEKGALIRGGVTAALVSRAVTGHGAITGGEGLI